MVQEHYRNGSFVPLIGMPLRCYFYNIDSVLEWQIQGEESMDEEASDDDDGDDDDDDDMSMEDSAE